MHNIKTILVIGCTGQLGESLKAISPFYKKYQFTFSTRNQMDLMNLENITNYFNHNHFDVIINCAAYTSVDKAEEEPVLADKINYLAVKKLAEISKSHRSILIHISTDYVFDGLHYKPYIESNKTNPKNIYGLTKLKGEQAIKNILDNAIIIRTSWIYSEFGNNFVKNMLRLSREKKQLNIISDQVGSPTYANDLAKCIMEIIANIDNKLKLIDNKTSIYHFSNEGICSWYDFSKSIFEISKIDCIVNPIETKDYITPAKRPYYSVLSKFKIKNHYELNIPYWKDSLNICLKKIHNIEKI